MSLDVCGLFDTKSMLATINRNHAVLRFCLSLPANFYTHSAASNIAQNAKFTFVVYAGL